MMCYPVISFSASYSHSGSAKRLLGPNATDEQLRDLSNDLQVTKETPPAFLFHTAGDTVVPPQNSLAFATACAEHGVPCELHLFQNGPHGVGMAQKDPAASHWPKLAIIWMRQSGFLTSAPRVAVSGSVQFDGKPVQSGEVVFVSEDPHAPQATTRFGGGRFRIDAAHGPIAGPAKVQILHNGSFSKLPSSESAVDLAPEGGLEVTITDEKNEFTFELSSE